MEQSPLLRELTAQIVTAYVSNVSVSDDELPQLIQQVHAVLAWLGDKEGEKPNPAVAPAKSLSIDRIRCMECGWGGSMLIRHLNAQHHLSPQQYREKWGFPSNYPMLAPAYSEVRSRVAKQSGLGRKPKKRVQRRDWRGAELKAA